MVTMRTQMTVKTSRARTPPITAYVTGGRRQRSGKKRGDTKMRPGGYSASILDEPRSSFMFGVPDYKGFVQSSGDSSCQSVHWTLDSVCALCTDPDGG
ncbi:hypothetical protein EYF80_000464 [Liparis tanakae]|uniref:Uncharacterized protein n=1 Tax=Liparis tanakae TaxID=230148 RepID=A0A4Z2JFZ6_9TELE|nr:hypothetical protein EYF80_000464 [Liparis tanakae]